MITTLGELNSIDMNDDVRGMSERGIVMTVIGGHSDNDMACSHGTAARTLSGNVVRHTESQGGICIRAVEVAAL